MPPGALDFCARDFDPLLALRTPGLQPPVPDAKPLDNLHKCRWLLPSGHPDRLEPRDRAPGATAARGAAKQRAGYQAQLRLRERPRECPIEALAEHTGRSGPSALLLRAFRSGARVAVVTRHRKGVRGVCTGTLVAFDKFVNLVLRDAFETYAARVPAPRIAKNGKPRLGWKLEQRTRSLKQVFLAGSAVVSVRMAQEET